MRSVSVQIVCMGRAALIEIEVAYALPERQEIVAIKVPEGTTAYAAVGLSGIEKLFDDIDLPNATLGIFGTVISRPEQHVLREGDRVEIYRPLRMDPKEARLRRARKGTQGSEGTES